MADDNIYNTLLSANPTPPPPPPPPPLPPPPPPTSHHQSRKVFARLAQPFIGTSRPPSSSGSGPSGLGGSGASGPTSAPNHLKPRNLKYDLTSPILALSANVDGDRIVVAGREILRILRVGINDITEVANLRLPGEQKKHFQYDVKWGPMYQKNIIATAGTNGTICLYDIKEGRLDRTLKEHGRQVHRLAFNQANGNLLLSASQDGTIKLWDLREKKSRHTFVGKAEAVRDVQFNVRNATEFAAAFDNGAVQRWDYRKESIYERKINAHNGPAFSVDWHPDGKHCASGGRDRTVKVWDFNADARRKPKHTITTMASVSRIAWRPLKNANTETTQLVTCAINNDHRVQLWDFKRPYIPSRIMDVHDNATTGMLWKDEDLLWSCSKDCTLVQNDVPFAPQPINSMTHNAFSWAPDGVFTFVSQRRGRSRHHGTGLSGSRSTFDTDEDISLREERRTHGRSSSFKSSKPNLNIINVFDMQLDKFTNPQAAAKVSIPSLFDKEAFDFFAERYVIDVEGVAGGKKMTLPQAFEKNARLAWRAQKYSTAKSWRMLQLTINSEDEVARLGNKQKSGSISSAQHNGVVARRALGFGPDHSSISGGATPLAANHSPKSIPTSTPNKSERLGDQLLRLPPAAFGTSPSSSTLSTDGEDSTTEPTAAAAAVAAVNSDSEAHDNARKHARPNLTFNTSNSAQPKARDFVVTQNAANTTTATHTSQTHRPPIDENHSSPLFTSTTERSDSMSASVSSIKLTSRLEINNGANGNNQHSTSHPTYSATTHTDTSFIDSPSLQRQFSLVSEQTSSSYSILESRSDLSDSESYLPTATTAAHTILPSITEEHPVPLPPPPPPPPPPTTTLPTEDKPWNTPHLATALLTHSTLAGDTQTAAVLILLLHRRLALPAALITDVLDVYLTQLTSARHFAAAALVRKLAPGGGETFNVDVDLSCGECGRAVGARGGGWCQKCVTRGGRECVICGERKGRRWTVCAVCGHGGCEGCVRGWFVDGMEERCAAVGCECVCLPR